MLKVKVMERAKADTDWDIGYLDNVPAVGNEGCWYAVPDQAVILNQYDGYIWRVVDGEWKSCFAGDWRGDITNTDEFTAGGPVYEEED